MPRYSIEPSKWQGAAYPKGLPIDVVDATGKVVAHEWIVYFETETGVVISSVRDAKTGDPILSLTGEPKYIVEVYPAPLSMRPVKKQNVLLPTNPTIIRHV